MQTHAAAKDRNESYYSGAIVDSTTQPLKQPPHAKEKVSICLWVTPCRQNVEKIVYDDHIPTFSNCCTAQFFLKK